MKLKLNRKKQMDIGTPEWQWMRATMPIGTGGADLAECLYVIDQIDGSDKSWVKEWSEKAQQLYDAANIHLQAEKIVTGKYELIRASNYFRVAMMRCRAGSKEADDLLTKSRESYIQALPFINSSIEFVKIPYDKYVIPAYYYNSGKTDAPTLIGVNGGDSTNEEMFNLFGFAAIERGWNVLIYEGPGQFTARQLNPDWHAMANWEEPNAAIIDWLIHKPEVAKDKIAMFGWSFSSNLVIRCAAFDKRIAAIISNGLVVDIYEAWYGIWPKWMRKVKPKYFDFFFHVLERFSRQLRTITSLFYQMHGVNTPTAMMKAWKAFTVTELANKISCPSLFITGEAEYAEQSAGPLIISIGTFLKNLQTQAWFHEFGFEEGWNASHCQIGAQRVHQELVYDWLEMVLMHPEKSANTKTEMHNFSKVIKYFGEMPEARELFSEIKIRSF